MKTILVTVILCLMFSATVQSEDRVICWRNAFTGERDPFDPNASVEKMREFVFPHDVETLSIYDDYIARGYSPLESYKGIMNYHAQKQREKARMNRRP